MSGIEIIKKPGLGNKPAWLESESENFISNIQEKIFNFKENENIQQLEYEEYLNLYKETQNIRDEFLLLIQCIYYVKDSEKIVSVTLMMRYHTR